jgi:hypothetical protein
MRSRLLDARFKFLFDPGQDFSPNPAGVVQSDLDKLVSSWVGHDRLMTVLDVSGIPSEILSPIVGSMLRVIYDVLFWAGDLPISGRNQPLLTVIDEAHLFVPNDQTSAAHRIIGRIAKEGRKYGVGLLVVSQRPSEVSNTILSQCGTIIAMRLLNEGDCAKVKAAMSDDLAGLTNMLPSLRTGEALIVGEAMPIPSRVRFKRAVEKPVGADPDLARKWKEQRPGAEPYAEALTRWRNQSG